MRHLWIIFLISFNILHTWATRPGSSNDPLDTSDHSDDQQVITSDPSQPGSSDDRPLVSVNPSQSPEKTDSSPPPFLRQISRTSSYSSHGSQSPRRASSHEGSTHSVKKGTVEFALSNEDIETTNRTPAHKRNIFQRSKSSSFQKVDHHLRKLPFTGSLTPYRNCVDVDNLPELKYPRCEPVRTWSIFRHTTRFPGNETIIGMRTRLINLKEAILMKRFESLRNNAEEGDSCYSKELEEWKLEEALVEKTKQLSDDELNKKEPKKKDKKKLKKKKGEGEEIANTKSLTPKGAKEMLDIGKRFVDKFGKGVLGRLFEKARESDSLLIRFTKCDRTQMSARMLYEGVFDEKPTGKWEILLPPEDRKKPEDDKDAEEGERVKDKEDKDVKDEEVKDSKDAEEVKKVKEKEVKYGEDTKEDKKIKDKEVEDDKGSKDDEKAEDSETDSKTEKDEDEKDPLLKYDAVCKHWKRNYKKSYLNEYDLNSFKYGKEMNGAIERIKNKCGFTENSITFSDVKLLAETCAFEQAWADNDKFNPWCDILTAENQKIYEYFEDFEFFKNDGPQNIVNKEIGCLLFQDMVKRLIGEVEKDGEDIVWQIDENDSATTDTKKATFYFTHLTAILKFITHLGIFTDENESLRKDNFEENEQRKWKSSYIGCFGTNITFVLMKCEKNNYEILTLHQEKPVHLPKCPETSDLCPLHIFLREYSENIFDCKYDQYCKADESDFFTRQEEKLQGWQKYSSDKSTIYNEGITVF